MYVLARKNYLGLNLSRMAKAFPDDYDFFPKTWVLPTDFHDLKSSMAANKRRTTYIVKPEAS
jgi:tubulin polyglutamylase TTLL6/13